jgi:hypothetical protein
VTSIQESNALHARVRILACDWAAGTVPRESFDTLALDIARYQAAYIPGVARLVAARSADLSNVTAIPAVPVEAFRLTRITAHPGDLDEVRFETSGTTGTAPGVHPMRTTETYRELALAMGRAALTSPWPGSRVVVALTSDPGPAPKSSLGFMMRAFIEEFDRRPLFGRVDAQFERSEQGRFLVGPSGVDVSGLARAAEQALARDEPLLVLGTGFSFMLLIDQLRGATIPAPARTVVMPTGGFKGKTREIGYGDLVRELASVFGIPETHVVGEYGMTELTSQLYEGVLPGGALSGERGVFIPPPWLRVTPVDPETLEPTPGGELGLARFTDLGNIDFPMCIVTQDLVRRRGGGVELLGRRQGAPPRGCSLAVEEMVLGAVRA